MDFASLVLGPCMDVFADPIMLTPTKSQPQAAAYPAQGIFAQKPVRIETENGGYLISLETTLGIRLADYPVPPKQGDSLVRSGVTWFVWSVTLDGQGGASLHIQTQRPT